ncbi:WXG100 family type VII secretion target [Rathayibacter sp. VKM Ac-2857]|jgi:hypothetical protein|uniref:WXG100 family type VII secretion target n=1 Tax=Rathayibacter sp. VKM Ac-2857 TaxID=2739020 RepID=UPI0015672F3F|nr:hypothetical protein [Rathayibacter sp. VKM Ac-2857]NQX16050.1 hypothetical protein [Rathayibacter sp. VKM Ac-2857]
MAVWGLDVEQVRTLSTKLTTEASNIQSILNSLTTQLGNTEWTGPDATQFRGDWSGNHTASLRSVINALEEAGRKASDNATQQDQISH